MTPAISDAMSRTVLRIARVLSRRHFDVAILTPFPRTSVRQFGEQRFRPKLHRRHERPSRNEKAGSAPLTHYLSKSHSRE
jgi:hypothetical protein